MHPDLGQFQKQTDEVNHQNSNKNPNEHTKKENTWEEHDMIANTNANMSIPLEWNLRAWIKNNNCETLTTTT